MKRLLPFRFPLPLLVAVTVVDVAACSSSDPPGAALDAPTRDASAAATDAARPGAIDASLDAGDAATAVDASADADADAAPVYTPGPSVCPPNMKLGPSTTVTTGATDRFGAISSDELTIAWTTPSGSDATLHWADRAVATDAFGAAATGGTLVAKDRVAVSVDGLGLLAVAPDHRSFVVLVRGARGDAFVAGSAEAYADLVAALGPTELLGDPVYTFGDQGLVYSVYGTSTDTVRYASRIMTTSPWSVGGTLAFGELRAQGTLRRRPTGAGSDFQTLFYFDEVDHTEKLAQLMGTIGVFSVDDLGGAHALAQPNATCTRVYFGTSGLASAPVQ